MPNFDMNMNSLPEQVQENKEKIAELETDVGALPTKEYVDDQDTATLNSAKLYADQTKIPMTFFTQKGQIMCAGELGGVAVPTAIPTGNDGDVLKMGNNDFPAWTAPTDIDKSIFTGAGSLITSDADNEPEELQAGNENDVLTIISGKPTWQAPGGGGGGMTLKWSGNFALTTSDQASPFTFASGKFYLITFADLGGYYKSSVIFNYDGNLSSNDFAIYGAHATVPFLLNMIHYENNNIRINYSIGINGSGSGATSSFYYHITNIYEIGVN